MKIYLILLVIMNYQLFGFSINTVNKLRTTKKKIMNYQSLGNSVQTTSEFAPVKKATINETSKIISNNIKKLKCNKIQIINFKHINFQENTLIKIDSIN